MSLLGKIFKPLSIFTVGIAAAGIILATYMNVRRENTRAERFSGFASVGVYDQEHEIKMSDGSSKKLKVSLEIDNNSGMVYLGNFPEQGKKYPETRTIIFPTGTKFALFRPENAPTFSKVEQIALRVPDDVWVPMDVLENIPEGKLMMREANKILDAVKDIISLEKIKEYFGGMIDFVAEYGKEKAKETTMPVPEGYIEDKISEGIMKKFLGGDIGATEHKIKFDKKTLHDMVTPFFIYETIQLKEISPGSMNQNESLGSVSLRIPFVLKKEESERYPKGSPHRVFIDYLACRLIEQFKKYPPEIDQYVCMDFLLKPEEYDGFFRQEFCRVNHKTTTIRELILERANRRRNLIKELYFLGRIISPETIEKLRENRWESEEEKRNILAIIEGEMRRITIKETKRGGKETMGIVEDDMPSPRKDIIYSHLEATGEGREKEGVVYCKEVKYKGEWKIAHRYTGTFLKKSIDEYEEWINQNF